TNSHGMHLLRSAVINAPLSPVFLMESSGIYNQNQLIANVNAKINGGLSLFGFYVLNYARSNTDGIGTFPARPYSDAGEYGPAPPPPRFRLRAAAGGSTTLRGNTPIRPSPAVQSAPPFDTPAGSDLYGTTLFNGRPGFATDPSRPGLVPTAYGLLDPNPIPGE